MSLEPTIADITARLRQGKFPNEQAISQGIVLRTFQELGWNTWDIQYRVAFNSLSPLLTPRHSP